MPIFALKALSFAASHWKAVLIALAFAVLGLKLLAAQGDARHWSKVADRNAALYHAEQSAHALTVAGYRKATAEAQAADAAHVIQIERNQAKVSQEVSSEYQTKLAALRARYDALRVRGEGSAASANPSGGDGAGLSQAGDPTSGSARSAGEEGLSLSDRFICSAQAEQLDALITFNLRQAAIESITSPQSR